MPAFLVTAAREFDRYAKELQTAAAAWQPTESRRVHRAGGDGADDERVLRPVEGVALRAGRRGRPARTSTSSRASSDIHDILAGLQVVYADVEPVVGGEATRRRRSRPASELDGLQGFIEDLWAKEQAASDSRRSEADVLGNEAQDARRPRSPARSRQAAAALGISVVE